MLLLPVAQASPSRFVALLCTSSQARLARPHSATALDLPFAAFGFRCSVPKCWPPMAPFRSSPPQLNLRPLNHPPPLSLTHQLFCPTLPFSAPASSLPRYSTLRAASRPWRHVFRFNLFCLPLGRPPSCRCHRRQFCLTLLPLARHSCPVPLRRNSRAPSCYFIWHLCRVFALSRGPCCQ